MDLLTDEIIEHLSDADIKRLVARLLAAQQYRIITAAQTIVQIPDPPIKAKKREKKMVGGPAKHGKRWTEEDKAQLLELLRNKMPIPKIAADVGRTVGSVYMASLNFVHDSNNNGKTAEEIANEFGWSIDDVSAALNEKAFRSKQI